MSQSSVSYFSTGGNRDFVVTFSYLAKAHVQVKVAGISDLTFTWLTGSTIRLTTAPAENALVEINRVTPQTPIVDFVDGSTLTEALLDTATNQAIFIAQEAFDGVSTSGSLQAAITAAAASATSSLSSYNATVASQLLAETARDIAITNANLAQAAAGSLTKATTSDALTGTEDTKYMTALKTKQKVDAALAGFSVVPVGILIDFAGTTAPTGFLACPLAATDISRTTYAALFAVLGTQWGAGDGSTTFGMPWFPADYASIQSSSNVGSKIVGENLVHTHIQNAHTHTLQTVTGSFGTGTGQDAPAGARIATTSNTINSATAINQNQGGAANLAAGVRVLKCVKF